MRRAISIVILCVFPSLLWAQNYQLKKTEINTAGGILDEGSSNYKVKASITVVGSKSMNAASYKMKIGLHPLRFNRDPHDISLGITNVDENKVIGTTIGLLSSTDLAHDGISQSNDIHTYSLVSGVGSADNALFSISGNQLKTNQVFDFEHTHGPTYSIRIRTDDGDGGGVLGIYDEVFTVTINNVTPTDIQLSGGPTYIFPENLENGADLGTLTTTEGDIGSPGENHTYSLVSGVGDADNQLFQINGDVLEIKDSLNFERTEGADFYLRIKTEDDSGESHEDSFVITVTDVDDPPRDIFFAGAVPKTVTISQDLDFGQQVALLRTLDDDDPVDDHHTYELVTGALDNDLFSLNGSNLVTATTFSQSDVLQIRVKSTDNDAPSLSIEKTLTVNVAPPGNNNTPYELTIDNSTILDIQNPGDVIGSFSTGDADDPNKEDTYIYSLVSGTGSDDNIYFSVFGDQLILNTTLDINTKSSYSIRVQTLDPFLAIFEEEFILEVVEFVNTPPTDILLSNSILDEDVPTGTTVGQMSSVDSDPNESFSYSLVSGSGDSDNGSFLIDGEVLKTNALLDFLVSDSLTVRVEVLDNYGGTMQKQFWITLNDVRSPLVSSLTPANGGSGFVKNANLVLEFNEMVVVGTGEISIHLASDNSEIESIDVVGPLITGSGSSIITINPVADLIGGESYYATISNGSFLDLAGNPFSGWVNDQSWKFTTYDDVPPEISLGPSIPKTLTQGSSQEVLAIVNDISEVDVFLHFGGLLTADDGLQKINVIKDGEQYATTLDDSQFDALGMKFFFSAVDVNGNEARTETKFISLRYTSPEGISGLRSGGRVQDYQIIAIPYELEKKRVVDVFSALGEYNKKRWRLIRYNTQNGLFEDFPSFTNMEVGQGYWFNMKDAVEIILEARETPEMDEDGYSMTLANGWNQIGNPFTVPLDWNKVLEDNGVTNEVEGLWVYRGGASLTTGTILNPFEGGFVRASQLITLNLLPGISGARRFNFGSSLDNEFWAVSLDLNNSNFSYNSGFFGMHIDASESHDQFDLSRPPHLLGYFDYFFDGENGEQLAAQIVPLQDTFQWDFIVAASDKAELTTLSWNNIDFGGQQLTLFDVQRQHAIDMSDMNSYKFYLSEERKFRIYLNVDLDEVVPDIVMLGEIYPNPSNREVNIPVTLSQNSQYAVRLSLYDLMGKEINVIADGIFGKGFHNFSWDGQNTSGSQVEPGIYIVRLHLLQNGESTTFNAKIVRR